MRRGLLPIIMLPDGNLLLKRCTYVRFLILTIWGSVRIIDLARIGNSGCANEILGCAKCHF